MYKTKFSGIGWQDVTSIILERRKNMRLDPLLPELSLAHGVGAFAEHLVLDELRSLMNWD